MAQSFYANNVTAAGSIGDIVLILRRDIPTIGENGKPMGAVTEEELYLILSPALGKGMLGALNTVISDYEKKFGKIPEATAAQDQGKK